MPPWSFLQAKIGLESPGLLFGETPGGTTMQPFLQAAGHLGIAMHWNPFAPSVHPSPGGQAARGDGVGLGLGTASNSYAPMEQAVNPEPGPEWPR